MITLRQVAQQALEALEAGPDVDPIFAGETADALRAALAEPQGEPQSLDQLKGLRDMLREEVDRLIAAKAGPHSQPQQAEPAQEPQRKPLSEVEIFKAYEMAVGKKLPNMGASRAELIAITRIVERAHGIGGEP